jgi:hypothetical protein
MARWPIARSSAPPSRSSPVAAIEAQQREIADAD